MKTKSILLLGFFSVLFYTPSVHAQLQAGLRDGLAASTFSAKGNLADNDKTVLSYLSGIFITMPLSNSFAIQPEVNYLKKGRSNETSQLGVSTETDFMINYLQVPMQLQYRNQNISKSGNSVFYFNAGPYAAFALDNERRVTSGGAITTLVTKDNKKTDWGLTLGLGLQTAVKSQKLRFDLKYDMGLSQIAGQPDDFRTKCLSFTVGVVL